MRPMNSGISPRSNCPIASLRRCPGGIRRRRRTPAACRLLPGAAAPRITSLSLRLRSFASSSASSTMSDAESWNVNPVRTCVKRCTPVVCFSQRKPVKASSSSLPHRPLPPATPPPPDAASSPPPPARRAGSSPGTPTRTPSARSSRARAVHARARVLRPRGGFPSAASPPREWLMSSSAFCPWSASSSRYESASSIRP